MNVSEREHTVAVALVELADTLVVNYDVDDLLYRLVELCVDLLEVDSVGLQLNDAQGVFHSLAATDDQAWSLEKFQEGTGEGPGADCVRTGALIVAANLAEAAERWHRFAGEVQRAGFESVHAVPLRLRGDTIGAVCLFNAEPGTLPEHVLGLGRAMADMATIAILQRRAIDRGEVIREQLQAAMDGRAIIEQAKGMLAHHGRFGVEEAFARLRGHARRNNLRLSELVQSVVAGNVDLDTLMDARPN